MKEIVGTEKMFQSTELGILVNDYELREFYNLAELPISLPNLLYYTIEHASVSAHEGIF